MTSWDLHEIKLHLSVGVDNNSSILRPPSFRCICPVNQHVPFITAYSGPVPLWCTGAVAQWHYHTVAQWHCGTVPLSYSGTVVQWHCGTETKTTSKLIYYSLLQFAQLCEWVPGYRQWWIVVYTLTAALLDISHRSRSGVWLNRSVRGQSGVSQDVKCNVLWPVLWTGHCAVYQLIFLLNHLNFVIKKLSFKLVLKRLYYIHVPCIFLLICLPHLTTGK